MVGPLEEYTRPRNGLAFRADGKEALPQGDVPAQVLGVETVRVGCGPEAPAKQGLARGGKVLIAHRDRFHLI